MASVKRFPDSKYWYACYKIPTGRLDSKGLHVFQHVQRSTKLTDKTQAMQVAISYERAAVAAAQGRWSQNQAERFLSELRAITGVSVAQIEATDIFLNRWFEINRRRWGKSTQERYRQIIDDYLLFLGDRRSGPLVENTGANVMRFRNQEIEYGKSAATVNKSLGVLAMAFDEAVTIHAIDKNPARGLNVAGGKKHQQQRRAFTFDQFRELVRKTDPTYIPTEKWIWRRALPEDWQTFVLICGYTGGRQQEVAQLAWNNIDFKRRAIRLHRGKTNDVHTVPMHAALAEHLEKVWRAKNQSAAGPVMPLLADMERRYISKTFRQSILPRIGIKQAYSSGEGRGKGRKLAEFGVHSLRHSLNTWLEAAGVDEKTRMDLVGHEDEEVNRGYTHTELETLSGALAKIPSL